MVISMGLDLPHGIPQSPIWGPGHVQSCHLMMLTLHTRWTLLGFCLHSHRNEVLGAHVYQSWWGSSCSPVFGLTSTAVLTNCLWIAWSNPLPFCHCLLTNVPMQLFPDMADPTFCSSPFMQGFGLMFLHWDEPGKPPQKCFRVCWLVRMLLDNRQYIITVVNMSLVLKPWSNSVLAYKSRQITLHYIKRVKPAFWHSWISICI